jgi:addiction module HigA family antidote
MTPTTYEDPWKNTMKTRVEQPGPVHPGDFLREDFMKPLDLTALAVANAIGATPMVVSQIIRRQRGVTREMALKLSRLFSVPPELWTDIQADYDREMARDQKVAESAN